MSKFIVYRQELHIQPVEIEAESAKEARRLVMDGQGEWDESHLYFNHDLDPEFWTVEPGKLDLKKRPSAEKGAHKDKFPVRKRGPYLWLQENEESGRAYCGCELQSATTGPALWLCPLHQGAEKLLAACKLAKRALDLNDEFGADIDRRHAAEEEAWHFLSEAIRDAEGKTAGRKP